MSCFGFLAETTTLSAEVTTVQTTTQEKTSVVSSTEAMSTSQLSGKD